jgi:AraC-like DNA-binding protein
VAIGRDLVHEWREQYARRVLNVDFTPLAGTSIRASFKPIFQDLRIARTALSAGITFRDAELVKDGDDAYSLLISLSKSLDAMHQGRELRLTRSEATILNLCEPGSVGAPHSFEYIAIPTPRSELVARNIRADEGVMRRVAGRSQALRLLRGYLAVLERNPIDTWEEGREAISRHIIDLVALAITVRGDLGDSDFSAVKAARLAAIIDHVSAHFSDQGLSVTGMADNLAISPRYLHRLLEASGRTFTQRVNELRLERALTLLTSSDGPRRISDIALRAGFSDISHFNRLFRARYGDAPTAFRSHRSRHDPPRRT